VTAAIVDSQHPLNASVSEHCWRPARRESRGGLARNAAAGVVVFAATTDHFLRGRIARLAIQEIAIMSSTATVRVLGIAGSLRQGSFNRATLRVAQELAPEGMQIDIFDITPIPAYNEDVRQQGFPSPVEDFRGRIKAADGLLIVTPEYNYSIPGVLKNAIDWASRPPEQPFDGKPIGLMGASGGGFGTARAQYHLRQCFVFLNGLVMNRPELMISAAHNKFDAAGKLTDQTTRESIAAHLAAFRAWVLRLR
jgi:chromate reductase